MIFTLLNTILLMDCVHEYANCLPILCVEIGRILSMIYVKGEPS